MNIHALTASHTTILVVATSSVPRIAIRRTASTSPVHPSSPTSIDPSTALSYEGCEMAITLGYYLLMQFY